MVIGIAMTGLKWLVDFTIRKCEINGWFCVKIRDNCFRKDGWYTQLAWARVSAVAEIQRCNIL
jgi:hypothetical protein